MDDSGIDLFRTSDDSLSEDLTSSPDFFRMIEGDTGICSCVRIEDRRSGEVRESGQEKTVEGTSSEEPARVRTMVSVSGESGAGVSGAVLMGGTKSRFSKPGDEVVRVSEGRSARRDAADLAEAAAVAAGVLASESESLRAAESNTMGPSLSREGAVMVVFAADVMVLLLGTFSLVCWGVLLEVDVAVAVDAGFLS